MWNIEGVVMVVTSFKANGFRNLKEIDLIFHQRLNILCGKNAQGKTNILEAIWICSGEKSFRNAKDKELIDIDGKKADVFLEFKDKRRTQNIECTIKRDEPKNKRLSRNGVKLKNTSELLGEFKCVIFTPEDLELSKGSPDIRRKFADLAISQLKISYRDVTEKYRRLLEQRNTQLKLIAAGKSDDSMLEIWDEQLSQMGAYISMLRYNYCKKLNKTAKELYSEISQEKEVLEIKYNSTVFKDLEGRIDYKKDLSNEYLDVLKNNRSEDIRAGFTLKGVHRDDFYCYINGMYVKDYASQGQHRSAALVMKLSQAYILKEESDDSPCILLDDVLSELDAARQGFVMNKIKDMQVIITCCDEELVKKDAKSGGKLFRIENGKII